MAGEKTEKATPKRKQDERKKGNIFQSKDVVTVFSLVAIFYAFKLFSPLLYDTITRCIDSFFKVSATMEVMTADHVKALYIEGAKFFLTAAMPLLLISGLVVILLTFLQTRMLVSTEVMKFKFERINPLSGFKKMFSLRGVVELIKSLLKITVLGYIIYNTFIKQLPLMPRLMDMSLEQSIAVFGDNILSLVWTVAGIFLFLAVADYVYQWWEYEKSLRMSKQEIKEEYKQTEGDPQIKGKIRERQRQMSTKRMMQAVPTADVIIRNPTHYAVALKYDPKVSRAPIVVAKGADHLALKIIEIAKQNHVVITENRPLARGLYEAVDLDREIPDQFYQAVAEVLAFVYTIKNKRIGTN